MIHIEYMTTPQSLITTWVSFIELPPTSRLQKFRSSNVAELRSLLTNARYVRNYGGISTNITMLIYILINLGCPSYLQNEGGLALHASISRNKLKDQYQHSSRQGLYVQRRVA